MKPDFAKLADGLKTIVLSRISGTGFTAVTAIYRAAEATQDDYESELSILLERWKREDQDNIVDPIKGSEKMRNVHGGEKPRFEIRLMRSVGEAPTLDARVILQRFPRSTDLLMFRCHARDVNTHYPHKERALLIAFGERAWQCGLVPADLPELLGPTALYAPASGSFLSAYLSAYPTFISGLNFDSEFTTAIDRILEEALQGETSIPHAKGDLVAPNAVGNIASILATPDWAPGKRKLLDAIIQWLEKHPSHLARKLPAVPWRWESARYRNSAGIVLDDPIRYLADLFWLALPALRIDPPNFEVIDGAGCMRDLGFVKSVLAEDGFLAERLDFVARERNASSDYNNWFREAEFGFDYDALTARWRARRATEIREPAQDGLEPIL